VTLSGGVESATGAPGRQSRATTVNGARARQLAGLVNSLEGTQPAVVACPSGDGDRLRITFRGPGATPLAQAEYVNDGCPTVRLQVGGRTGPLLTAGTLGDPPRTVIGDIVSDHLVPRCRAAQLSLSATVSIPPGEDGSIGFTLVNRSDDLCSAGGVPKVGLLTASRRALPTHESVVRATVSNPPSLMFPGSEAQFDAVFAPCPGGPAAQAVRVRLPHGGGALTATMGLIDPCNDTITVSALAGP
jgi:hypothetical protein